MSDEQDAEAAQSATATEPEKDDELTIINGGVEITVVKIDGTHEEVKVRQLPIRLVPDWGQLQGDEASLVELLCDKQGKNATEKLRNERAAEWRLLALMQQAAFEQIPEIEKQLGRVRGEIEKLEATARWSDSLTEESSIAIRELGERLNQKRFGRWATRTREAASRTMKEARREA